MSARCRSAAALALIALVLGACALDPDNGEPNINGEPSINEDQDDNRPAQTAAVFAEFDDASPGCAVAVRYGDGATYLGQFGQADLDAAAPISASTIFDIGSVSKQITAGAIALLVVEGDLSLDDDVTQIVDEIGPYNETITVGDLVHHTSGLPDYIDLLDAGDDEVTTMTDALQAIASPAGDPVVKPGTSFEYSNTNYVLLSVIVERVTGQSLGDYTQAAIFEPLGMDDSTVRDDQGALILGQAQGYEPDGDQWEPAGSSWQQTGDGAVHTTAADLLAWVDLFVADAQVGNLGSPEWLNVMLAPGSVADEAGEYGGGIEIIGSGDEQILRHGGSWIGYGSAIVMQPSEGRAVAVTCNIDGVEAEGLAASTFDIWS